MKKYQNLKAAYKIGFRIFNVTYLQCIEEFQFRLCRENKNSTTYMDIWTRKIPKYITSEYFKNKDCIQLVEIILQK